MYMSKPGSSASLPKQDPVAFTFLIAVGLAVAVTSGAALSGIASGAVQNMMRTAGFGQSEVIKSEQQLQALELAKIGGSLGQVRSEIARLTARADAAADALQHQAAKPGPTTSRPTDIDLATLRTTIDEHEQRNSAALTAVNKRIDWLETLVYSQDATSSVQPTVPATRRRGAKAKSAWIVLHAEEGLAVIGGAGGTIDVTPGYVMPELGRVAAIRQRGGHWEVVTEKGTLTQR
jgi:hypothetical protein